MKGILYALFLIIYADYVYGQKVEISQLKVVTIPVSTSPGHSMIVADGAGNILKKPLPTDSQSFIVSTKGDTVRLTNSSSFIIVPGSSARIAPQVTDGSGNIYKPVSAGPIILLQPSRALKFNDGTPIPKITANADWLAATGPAYCWYNNDSLNFHQFGPLYNGYVKDGVTNGGKNVCPIGYHVMKLEELRQIGSISGCAFKDTTTAYWELTEFYTPGCFPSNEIGTNLRGSGQRRGDNATFNQNKFTFYTWLQNIVYRSGQWYLGHQKYELWPNNIKAGMSILCVKD